MVGGCGGGGGVARLRCFGNLGDALRPGQGSVSLFGWFSVNMYYFCGHNRKNL
jgi:hypothetical protein